MISLLILCATIVSLFLLLLLLLIFAIEDKKFEKEWAKKEEIRKNAECRLTDSLKMMCSLLDIDLSYHKELGTAAGRILYLSMAGRLFVDDARIEILEKYENDPYVLAHELGHYMAIKQRQDNSEEGADSEAEKLCRLILNQQEQELLKIALHCYFGKG